MTKDILLFISFLIFGSFISCADNSSAIKQPVETESTVRKPRSTSQTDTSHMYTGFYFLADGSNNGVTMRVENSNEYYILARSAFASVDNIKSTSLKVSKLDEGDYTELCLVFDSKGTKDLENGTGNAPYPKIAVVVAGKLLYVVDNTTKITTGVMCIGLVGFSAEEMVKIKASVDSKF